MKSARDAARLRSKGTRESKLTLDASDLIGIFCARRKLGSLQVPKHARRAMSSRQTRTECAQRTFCPSMIVRAVRAAQLPVAIFSW